MPAGPVKGVEFFRVNFFGGRKPAVFMRFGREPVAEEFAIVPFRDFRPRTSGACPSRRSSGVGPEPADTTQQPGRRVGVVGVAEHRRTHDAFS